jgi:hypothetical protein
VTTLMTNGPSVDIICQRPRQSMPVLVPLNPGMVGTSTGSCSRTNGCCVLCGSKSRSGMGDTAGRPGRRPAPHACARPITVRSMGNPGRSGGERRRGSGRRRCGGRRSRSSQELGSGPRRRRGRSDHPEGSPSHLLTRSCSTSNRSRILPTVWSTTSSRLWGLA